MRNQRVKVSTLGYGATKIGGGRIYSNNFSGIIVALKKALFYYEGLSVRQSGFEPETVGLENRCSIQLSYWRVAFGNAKVDICTRIPKYHLLFFVVFQ